MNEILRGGLSRWIERDLTTQGLKNRISIFAPVRRLPNDALRHIFEMSFDERVRQSGKPIPWHLGYLCHHWREQLSPFLWTDLSLKNIHSSYLPSCRHGISRTSPLTERRVPDMVQGRCKDIDNHDSRACTHLVAAGGRPGKSCLILAEMPVSPITASGPSHHYLHPPTSLLNSLPQSSSNRIGNSHLTYRLLKPLSFWSISTHKRSRIRIQDGIDSIDCHGVGYLV